LEYSIIVDGIFLPQTIFFLSAQQEYFVYMARILCTCDKNISKDSFMLIIINLTYSHVHVVAMLFVEKVQIPSIFEENPI
jgi:hypothetical protein